MTTKTGNIHQWNEWKSWETLKLETNGDYPEIGLLTLNRPDKLNAINVTMIDDLHSCLDFLNRGFDCRVVVIRGSGRIFCAGTDLSLAYYNEIKLDWTQFPDNVKKSWQIQHELSAVIIKLRRIPQPLIAAVHGAAVGGGMAIANASDIVFAVKNARFINAFIKIGVSGADCGSSYFLPRLVGFHRSAELMYTGRDLTAEEAHRWGYVNYLVEGDEAPVSDAVKFAAEFMLTRSPLGLRMTKEALNFNIDAPGIDSAVKFEDRNQILSAQTKDAAEGVKAFFEKRPPEYGSR
ncbi:MAG: enoyl-CoA hydratase/isomerase family protein [Spirochaetes bacterium]|nr:enoyl-CoA hydratase/isomerase family protein [Spirochaetota bacterium]